MSPEHSLIQLIVRRLRAGPRLLGAEVGVVAGVVVIVKAVVVAVLVFWIGPGVDVKEPAGNTYSNNQLCPAFTLSCSCSMSFLRTVFYFYLSYNSHIKLGYIIKT